MKNTWGNAITLTLFGESHGPSIGFVLDGLAPGLTVDEEIIRAMLALRRPSDELSTARREQDEFVIESGVKDGKTTGTPLCLRIPNKDVRSSDYAAMAKVARPSHADYTANCKYHGFEDARGGGHFSGRLTAALVAAGGILLPALKKKGIDVGTHVRAIGSVCDRDFDNIKQDLASLENKAFAVLDEEAEARMKDEIRKAKADGDSIGGMLETVVTGLEAGLGEPWFDTVEGLLAHALFSIPAVKGVEFGAGFALASQRGSEANDAFAVEEGKIVTKTNNSGGINGGLTNGMPVVFRTAFRPTPTIAKEQQSVDYEKGEEVVLAAKGRHDPCIVHRARIVVDAVTALVLYDVLAGRHGTDWFYEA